MKNCLKVVLLVLLIVAMLPVCVFAATETSETENVIYLDNGSYITIELSYMESRASGTKSGSKTYRYNNSDGVEEWRAVLTGSFTYTGTTATCTASGCSVTITNDNWYTVSKTASKSGASALGELTMGRKWLGITVDKETLSMKITCDASGNLS